MRPTATPHPSAAALAAFALGKLAPAPAAAVETHLADCPDCRAVAAQAPADSVVGLLRQAAAATPLGQLMVETDAPFLTPMPYRGRPNAPYLVPLTVRALAEVQGVGEDDVAAAVSTTAERVFGSW